jgi:hypothetical protein
MMICVVHEKCVILNIFITSPYEYEEIKENGKGTFPFEKK